MVIGVLHTTAILGIQVALVTVVIIQAVGVVRVFQEEVFQEVVEVLVVVVHQVAGNFLI